MKARRLCGSDGTDGIDAQWVSLSPYQAFGAALNTKRLAPGAPSDLNNVFQWDGRKSTRYSEL
jgi:hypothetical protein